MQHTSTKRKAVNTNHPGDGSMVERTAVSEVTNMGLFKLTDGSGVDKPGKAADNSATPDSGVVVGPVREEWCAMQHNQTALAPQEGRYFEYLETLVAA
jgi:hypothetical protein